MKPVYDEANNSPEAKAAIKRAIDRVLSVGLEGVVRTIAMSGRFDGTANWERVEGPYRFSCTSGAGTNGARVMADGSVLYDSWDRGNVLVKFHDGEWVEWATELAKRIAEQTARERQASDIARRERVVAAFSPAS